VDNPGAGKPEYQSANASFRAEPTLDQNSIPYRIFARLRKTIRPPLRRLAPPGTRRRQVVIRFKRLAKLALTRGPRRVVRKLIRVWEWPQVVRALSKSPVYDLDINARYQEWRRQTVPAESSAREMRTAAAQLEYRPLISVIIPVYNPEPAWLRAAVDSVRAQYYDNWQLCIADDASNKQGVRELLDEYAADRRIKVVFQPANQGISAASNAALAVAEGEYVAFLDHDDELSPDALYQVVKFISERGELEFIYSDEDKRDPSGAFVSPFFKPDWSPDLEYSSNYVTHFSVYRRAVVEQVGGFRAQFDGSQDYDLALRVTERSDRIGHIRKVLYTWRMVPGSAAASLEAKPYAYTAATRALSESLERRGIDGWVEDGASLGWYRVRYRIAGAPLVSVIIPTRDRADLLAKCLDSLKASTYKRLEIIVVDNGSVEEATRTLFNSRDLKLVPDPGDFNFSRLINAGAAASNGDYFLLLNNDVEAINPDWIEAMLEHAQRPEVAVVGARLLYPNGRPQHEGVALGIAGTFAGHIDWRNYLGLSQAVRNCSAVTAAAALTRRSVFVELGAFDESFRVAYGDVDYCLRARERGYLIVYTPYAALYHHESATRGSNNPPDDELLARLRWGGLTDPYYNYAFDDVLRPWVFAPER
jgi:GT2 family glycosyltransferase